MTSPDSHRALIRKFVRRTAGSLVFLGVILFGAAGTLNWPEAWIYLALTATMSFGGGFWLARHDPALLRERLGSLKQPKLVEFRDALPREESGKIFKRRLRDPYWQDQARRI